MVWWVRGMGSKMTNEMGGLKILLMTGCVLESLSSSSFFSSSSISLYTPFPFLPPIQFSHISPCRRGALFAYTF